MKSTLMLIAMAILGSNGLSLHQATAGDDANIAVSYSAKSDFALTADADAAAWKGVPGVFADKGRHGEIITNHRTEIRSQWTPKNLYFLFICPYEQLHLKPNPSMTTETNLLWEWDVAEVFIGTELDNIKHYTEFQVSPQGEWVDLDIDRKPNATRHDVSWNSGFEVKARIDRDKKVWFGAMRIPLAKIDRREPKDGLEMRINFYRIQGPGPDRKMINWQPVNNDSFHTPEAFGRLRLSAKSW
jgi:hypothetical protein